jgi:hypothetical protein
MVRGDNPLASFSLNNNWRRWGVSLATFTPPIAGTM